jgi:hypothetical protein
MLSIVILSIVMLSVIMLSVVMLIVEAPQKELHLGWHPACPPELDSAVMSCQVKTL